MELIPGGGHEAVPAYPRLIDLEHRHRLEPRDDKKAPVRVPRRVDRAGKCYVVDQLACGLEVHPHDPPIEHKEPGVGRDDPVDVGWGEVPLCLRAGELFAAGDIAALEYLHEQLGGDENHFKAAETLATNGNSRGVEHLLELFKGRASKNGSRNINYSAIVASLDAFLLNFDPSSQERDQILDALVAQLDKRAIQDRVFRILQRESRIDFGGILSASRNAGDRVRSEAVKKAREWWAKRKGK